MIKYNPEDIIAVLNCMDLVMAEKSDYSTVKKILILQALIIIIVTSGFVFSATENMVLSSLFGGMIAFLPNLYFAYRMSLVKEKSAKKFINSFYTNESRKILMTFVLFAVVFQIPGIQFFPLMACFIAVISVFWLALILFAQDFEIKSVRKDV